MGDARLLADLVAAVGRVEQRQAAYQQVAHRILDALEVHTEKLDAILEAATQEAGPSPVQELLAEILKSLHEQERLLTGLPDALAETVRDELQRELDAEEPEMEAAGPDSFEDGEAAPPRARRD